MMPMWHWNWLFDDMTCLFACQQNCFFTMSPRKSLLTKANWLKNLRVSSVRQAINSCQSIRLYPNAGCVSNIGQSMVYGTYCSDTVACAEVTVEPWRRCDKSWGSAWRWQAFQAYPMSVTVKTICQGNEKFCPGVHFIPVSAVTATLLGWGLMRWRDGNMWHMLGKLECMAFCSFFWILTLFCRWLLDVCVDK